VKKNRILVGLLLSLSMSCAALVASPATAVAAWAPTSVSTSSGQWECITPINLGSICQWVYYEVAVTVVLKTYTYTGGTQGYWTFELGAIGIRLKTNSTPGSDWYFTDPVGSYKIYYPLGGYAGGGTLGGGSRCFPNDTWTWGKWTRSSCWSPALSTSDFSVITNSVPSAGTLCATLDVPENGFLAEDSTFKHTVCTPIQ
jgi:hypothetical protein